MLHRVVLHSHGFFITHFNLCFFRFSAISIESEQLNSLEGATQNNGENKDYKGKIPEHHDVVTSTYSCELRHGTRNYTQIWAVVRWMWKTCASVDQQRLAAVLTAEESVSSYLFLKEKQNEWRKSAQHFLWLVLEKTFIYLLKTVTMQRDLVSTCIFYFKYDVNMCIFSAIKHGLKRTYFSMLLLQSCNMKGFQKYIKMTKSIFVHRNNCNKHSIMPLL